MSKEIDALVAEHIMGWRDSGIKPHYGATVWVTGDDANPTYTGFYPSTKIEPAWLVVEKMREQGFTMEAGLHRDGGAYARIEDGSERYAATSNAEGAPMAICLAALKALSVEAPE